TVRSNGDYIRPPSADRSQVVQSGRRFERTVHCHPLNIADVHPLHRKKAYELRVPYLISRTGLLRGAEHKSHATIDVVAFYRHAATRDKAEPGLLAHNAPPDPNEAGERLHAITGAHYHLDGVVQHASRNEGHKTNGGG